MDFQTLLLLQHGKLDKCMAFCFPTDIIWNCCKVFETVLHIGQCYSVRWELLISQGLIYCGWQHLIATNTGVSCQTARLLHWVKQHGHRDFSAERSCFLTSYWTQAVLCCLLKELFLHIQFGNARAVGGRYTVTSLWNYMNASKEKWKLNRDLQT